MTHSDNTTGISEAAVFLTICQLETEYERVKLALQEELQGEQR
nr:hypothetical protein [Leptolyngbya sp. FACHB-261]